MGNYQSSEGFTKTYTTKDAVILSGQSLSAAIDLEQLNIATIIFPASWTTADITFQTSADGVTYADVINDSGVEVKRTPVAGKAMGVSIPELSGVRFLKIRSGTSASPVNQGADRTLTLTLTNNAEAPAPSTGGGASTVADGADVNAGSTTDTAVVTDANGTLSAKLRGLVKIFADVWNSTDHALRGKWVDRLDETNDAIRAVTEGYKSTYHATVTDLALAASATDVFEIKGSASKTIRVLGFIIGGVQTTAGIINADIVKRSTANTSGTSSAPTAVPLDSADGAATAGLKAYTANPTTGTLIGKVFSRKVLLPAVADKNSAITEKLMFEPNGKMGVLRGTGESFCVNLGGVTVTGGTLNITVIFTEE